MPPRSRSVVLGTAGALAVLGAGGAQGSPIGSVADKHGSTLYVKDRDGNTVRVKTSSHSKIDRTASTSAGAIHPGDTVIVQGTSHPDGSITATQVNATAAGATGDCTTLGPDCTLIVVSPLDGSPAQKAGLLAGDAILKVDGAGLDGLTVDGARNKVRDALTEYVSA